MSDLWGMAKNNVKAQLLPLMPKNGGNLKVEEMFLGLPIHQEAK